MDERTPSNETVGLVGAQTPELASSDPDRPAESSQGHADRRDSATGSPRPFTDRTTAPQIDRFKVLGPIGRGGMGTVYAAYDELLDRKVAIKVLTEDQLPNEQDRARFQREGQALARLSHPHIVTVYEVGETHGQLFLAMEFIRGQTLAQWLRAAPDGPGWTAALEAFIQAGQGLVAIHQAGLVHRDLKPHNIMRRDDGVVKILDFGLARAVGGALDSLPDTVEGASMGPGSSLSSSLTRPGTVVGTPAYTSPEQLCGEVADARSDQFSFCVALYEAVYRQRPYPGQTIDALRTSILAGRVRPPPTDRPVPARLRTALTRGLATDPEARWPSMEALLAQLQQLLAPRRGRWWALSASMALGLGLLGVGLAYRANTGQRCTGARAQLDGIWDDARRHMVEAAILGTELSHAPGTWERVDARLGAYADTWMDKYTEVCEATSVHHEQSDEAMSLRMRCLGQRRTSLHATVDVLAGADAVVVNNAVKLVAGLPRLTRCDDLEWLEQQDQSMPPPEDLDVAAEVEALREHLAGLNAMHEAGRYAQALETVEPMVQRAEALGYPPLFAEALHWRGVLRDDNGEYDEAEQDLQRAHTLAVEHHHDQTALETAQKLTFVVGYRLARHTEGQQWGEMVALPLAQRSGEPVDEALSLDALAGVYTSQGEYDKAKGYLERALRMKEQALGADHLLVTMSLSNLGIAYFGQGEYENAKGCFLRALEIEEEALGADHPGVAENLTNLGNVYFNQGAYEDAKGCFLRALRIWEKALGADHPDVAKALLNLGNVYSEHREFEDTREHYERALRIWEETLGVDHLYVALILNNLGIVYRRQGKYEDAKRFHQRALAVWEKTLGSDHPDVAKSLDNLGFVYWEQGEYEEAKRHHQQALAVMEKALGPDHPNVADSLVGLTTAMLKMDEPESARAHAERAVSIREAAAVAPELRAEARFALAQALWSDEHEQARSRALAEQAREALIAAEGTGFSDVDLAEVEAWLAAHRVE